jgi:hypothetical protein
VSTAVGAPPAQCVVPRRKAGAARAAPCLPANIWGEWLRAGCPATGSRADARQWSSPWSALGRRIVRVGLGGGTPAHRQRGGAGGEFGRMEQAAGQGGCRARPAAPVGGASHPPSGRSHRFLAPAHRTG